MSQVQERARVQLLQGQFVNWLGCRYQLVGLTSAGAQLAEVPALNTVGIVVPNKCLSGISLWEVEVSHS